MKRNLLIVIVALSLVAVYGFSVYSLIEDKVVFENYDIAAMSSAQDITEVLSVSDKVEILVKVDYDDFKYTSSVTNEANVREVDLEIERNRKAGKEYHYQRNLQIYKDLGLNGYEYSYVSSYLPFIEYVFTTEVFCSDNLQALKVLSQSTSVEKIFVKKPVQEITPSLSRSLEGIGAYQDFSNKTYTGRGIKIGVLDGGIIDKNHSSIKGSNYVIRTEWYYIETVGTHATQMAAIIGGNYGICPDATIYSVELFGNPVSELDWLIANGVHIINVSMGIGTADGIYSSNSAQFDYVIYTYNVLVVAAVGNEGETTGYVYNPALGYNVLSVGLSGGYNAFVSAMSSFKVAAGGPSKPTFVAPGYNMQIPGYSSYHFGTSLSAAFTSGIAGMLMEAFPQFKNNAMLLITAMTSYSRPMYTYDYYDSAGFDISGGAGGLRYDLAFENQWLAWAVINNYTTYPSQVLNLCFNMYPNESMYVSIGWLAKATGSVGGTSFTNYDIYVYDYPSMTLLGSATSTHNNIEVVRVLNSTTYRQCYVVVKMNGPKAVSGPENVYFAIAFDQN